MEGCGVIVECFMPSGRERKEEGLSCSGLHLGGGLILTHSTLVSDILRHPEAQCIVRVLQSGRHVKIGNGAPHESVNVFEEQQSEEKISDEGERAVRSINPRFQVTLPAQADTGAAPPDTKDSKSQGQVRVMESVPAVMNASTLSLHHTQRQKPAFSPGHKTFGARLERLFIIPGLRDEIERLMPSSEGWKFVEEEEEGEKEKKADYSLNNLLMSTFVLLRVIPYASCGVDGPLTSGDDNDVAVAAWRMLVRSTLARKGTTVYVESSPFGSLSPSVFLNSLSRGMVSNTTGPLLLTDARAVVGSEGAPVFTSAQGARRHCALVISPFCWRKGEWVGLTMLAALPPVLHTILQSYGQSDIPPSLRDDPLPDGDDNKRRTLMPDSEQREEDEVASVERGVVAVWAGRGWGSGVVVSADPPLVITCSHVTAPAASGKVVLLASDGRRVEGRVLHQTWPLNPRSSQQEAKRGVGRCMWDVAVVEASQPLPPALTLATRHPHAGSEVLVAGYGMFSPNKLPSPSVSQGIVSRVITAPSSILTWPQSTLALLSLPFPHHQLITTQGHLLSRACDSSYRPGTDVNNSGDNDNPNPQRLEFNTGNSEQQNSRLRTHEFTDEPQQHSPPAVTQGRAVPVVMQTTCTVFAGTSGGPVVSLHPTQGPEVVGVVVCNTRDTVNQTTFPSINLAVPSPLLAWIIASYLRTRDVRILRLLDVECSMVSHLWSLGAPPLHRL